MLPSLNGHHRPQRIGCPRRRPDGSRGAQTPTASSATSTAATTKATSATTVKPAGEKVGAAELPGIVANRTFRGKDDAGEAYSEYYATDGTSETECYAVFKDGDVLTWATSDGEVVEATYAEGNPDNL